MRNFLYFCSMFFYNHINNINKTMRTKFFQWVMAATLICGASVFTSCNNDDNDDAAQANENRREFVEHCRSNLKELAENLNFGTWEVANAMNQHFNEYVLSNPAFFQTVAGTFLAQALQNVQPVDPASELAQMGYTQFAVVDFSNFKFRFTMSDDGTTFNVEPAESLELLLSSYDPETQQVVPQSFKVTMKAGGPTFQVIMKIISKGTTAFIATIPTDFVFAISSKVGGSWNTLFKGAFKNDVRKDGSSQYIEKLEDAFNLSGTIESSIPKIGDKPADATTLNFAIGQDPNTHEAGVYLGYVHNGKEIIKMRGVLENLNGMTDYSQLTSSMTIAEMFINVMAGNNVKEGVITLLDDLTTSVKVSDCAKVVELQNQMARARRNYADEATIDQYTQQLNNLISGSMTCAHTDQQIPMKLQTVKFGVDYWAVPALKFSAGTDYEPITNMLDKESIAYMINIADHAAEPVQQSLVTVRQLMHYLTMIFTGQQTQQQGQ